MRGGILGLVMSDSLETPTVDTAATETVPAPLEKTTMDIVEIMSILPHRYPFLLIDRVVEMERKKRIVAIEECDGE